MAARSDGMARGPLGRRDIASAGRALRVGVERVTFESTWLFWSALLLGVLRYADYTDFSERQVGSGIKYALFAVLLATLATIAIRSKRWRLGWNAPTIFLAFTFFACTPLLIQLAQGAAPDGYSSAFCSSLVYSMAAFSAANGEVKFDTLQKRLAAWLRLLGLIYIGELLLRVVVPAYFPLEVGATNQLKSAAILIGIYLTTLSGQRRRTAFLYAVMVVFLVLRPTSTVVFCLAVCIPIIALIRNARYRAAERICYVILFVLAIFPFLIHSFDDVSSFVNDVEGFVKTDTLGGSSNTQVRLDILRIAIERWQASSLLFGELFAGGTTVFLGEWWLSFTKTGLIPIHSDYVIILVEGGLFGYAALNLAFAWIIKSHFRWLRRQPHAKGNPSAQAAIVAVAIPVTISLAIISSANPYLQYYGSLFVVWFVLLCSEICKYTGRIEPARGGVKGSAAARPGLRTPRERLSSERHAIFLTSKIQKRNANR